MAHLNCFLAFLLLLQNDSAGRRCAESSKAKAKVSVFPTEAKKLGKFVCEKRKLRSEINIQSENDRFLFLLKQKNVFYFVSLQSENNKVEAKRKI